MTPTTPVTQHPITRPSVQLQPPAPPHPALADRPVYLDYNATTPIDPRVAEAMRPALMQVFGNPSSAHAYGPPARAALDHARAQVAALIGAGDPNGSGNEGRIVFTGSGSEADALAIRGTVLAALGADPTRWAARHGPATRARPGRPETVPGPLEHPRTDRPRRRPDHPRGQPGQRRMTVQAGSATSGKGLATGRTVVTAGTLPHRPGTGSLRPSAGRSGGRPAAPGTARTARASRQGRPRRWAPTSGRHQMATNIVIIGGSFGGLTTAYELHRHLRVERARITLIAKGPRFVFVPSPPWVAMGCRSVEQISFDLAPVLARKHVEFAHEDVQHIDPQAKTVTTDRGEHRYDFLVVATGHRSANEAVAGLGPFDGLAPDMSRRTSSARHPGRVTTTSRR